LPIYYVKPSLIF